MAVPRLVRQLVGLLARADAERTRPAAEPPTGRGGFVHGPHSRRAPLGWRIGAAVAVVLVVGTGLWHLFGLPLVRALSGPAPVPPPVETIDLAAASSLAAGFTADYWSHDSASPAARADALTRWTGGTVTLPGIEGPGSLRTDIVTIGAAITHGPDTAVVRTTARVRPAAEGPPPDPTAPAGGGVPYAADPGQLPAPGKALWLSLDVVVADTGTGLAVTGAALSGDAPTAIPRPTVETDGQTTARTTADGLPADILGAYAAGDGGQLAYLITPDAQLDGLSGAVTLADVTGWSMAADHADNGTRYVTADVTWSLTGTQLLLTQPYALTLTDVDGRWLLDAIGPRMEETP